MAARADIPSLTGATVAVISPLAALATGSAVTAPEAAPAPVV